MTTPDEIDALKAALAAERTARQQAEARASGAEAMVAHLKLLIAKMKHDRYGQSSERGQRLLDQLELQLEELEASAAEDEAAIAPAGTPSVVSFTRSKPVRAPLPAHLPRERIVIAAPSACPCCGGRLAKLGEDITETLEVVPRQWKVIQTVREKFTCRRCEAITQPPAPPELVEGPSDRAGTRRGEPVGDGSLCQVRRAPAAQPAERELWPRRAAKGREGIELDTSTPAFARAGSWRTGSAPAPPR